MKGIAKAGLTVVTALAAVTGGEVVAEIVEHTQIVEQYNFNNVHEINVRDTYKVNGVEVTEDEFMETLDRYNSIVTRVTDNTIQVIDEKEFVLYYGALTDCPSAETDLADLTEVTYENVPSSFTELIAAGFGEGRHSQGQYITVVIPVEYEVTSITTSGFSIEFAKAMTEGYDIFYITEPVTDLVGTTYTFNFSCDN